MKLNLCRFNRWRASLLCKLRGHAWVPAMSLHVRRPSTHRCVRCNACVVFKSFADFPED